MDDDELALHKWQTLSLCTLCSLRHCIVLMDFQQVTAGHGIQPDFQQVQAGSSKLE
jgi:hypothetical protein